MISQYRIRNFKIHRDTTISMAPLTILTGANSSGKSSVIQSMLMLRESLIKNLSTSRLLLKGDSYDVGGKASILLNWSESDATTPLSMSLTDDGTQTYNFEYNYPADYINDPGILSARTGSTVYTVDQLAGKLPLFNDNFQYLSAFRYGPRQDYDNDNEAMEAYEVSGKMGRGEYGVMLLHRLQLAEIPIAAMRHSEEPSLILLDQVTAWMQEISPGVRINIDRTGDRYKLNLGYGLPGSSNRYASAMNSGYGLGYSLSVLVALLTSRPGGMVIIENPEAHIHPSAQAAIMRMIAIAAANGVQVIVETHSDHVINASLVGLKTGILAPGQVSIVFFTRDAKTLSADPVHLTIGSDCRIKDAPHEFFGQMRDDMNILFGI